MTKNKGELPQKEMLTEEQIVERGREAQAFLASPEYQWLVGAIDRKLTDFKLEKLALTANGADRLRDLVVAMEAVEDLKRLAMRDLYAAKQAIAREAKRTAGQ